MRKRNHTVTIRMNKEEYDLFQSKVKESGRKRKAPPFIDFPFLKQAGHAPLRCEVSDNHVPYPAPYIFSLPVCTPLSSANTFLPYFPVISVFLFLNCFLFLLKGIKIAVMNISPTHNV